MTHLSEGRQKPPLRTNQHSRNNATSKPRTNASELASPLAYTSLGRTYTKAMPGIPEATPSLLDLGPRLLYYVLHRQRSCLLY